jgi:phosphoglycolate phosphatase
LTGASPGPLNGSLRAVAFDLDGTLIHSVPDLAQAVEAMLVELGQPALPDGSVAALIGNGFEALVERAYERAAGRPVSRDELKLARSVFTAAYSRRLFDRSVIYPRVESTIDALLGRGLRVGCITNKSAVFAQPLLEAAGLRARLDFVIAPVSVAERKPSPVLLQRALAHWGIAPAQMLYVGDSRVDIGAARAAGAPVAYVRYGYGRPAEGAPPDWELDCVSELLG